MWKHYLLGGLVSLAAIYVFVSKVPLAEMGRILAGIRWPWLLPCAALYLLSYLFRALRWHYLLRPVGRVPLARCFAALMVGFLGNNLLPAHLGEVVRAYVVGRKQNLSASAALATVVLERVYDGLTVLLLLLMVLLFMDLPSQKIAGTFSAADLRQWGLWGLALFAGLLVALQVFRWQRQRALKVCAFCCRPLPETWGKLILQALDSFADGLALSRGADLAWIGFHSLLTWLTLCAWAWSLFPAFGLHFGFLAGVLLQVVLALALLIPAAPGFLGVWHLAATAVLAFMGQPTALGGAYATALWAVHFVVSSAVGAYCLWRLGLGLGALRAGARQPGA